MYAQVCVWACSSQREGRVEVGVMTASTHTGEEEERKSESVSKCLSQGPVTGALVFLIPHFPLLSQAAFSFLHSHVKERIPQTWVFLSPLHQPPLFLSLAF